MPSLPPFTLHRLPSSSPHLFSPPTSTPLSRRLHLRPRTTTSSSSSSPLLAAAPRRGPPLPVGGSGLAAYEDDFFSVGFDAAEGEDDEDAGSPWEGAVVYRRDAGAGHVEYSTSLERLGLGDLSTPESRARAAAMGIRAPARAAKVQASEETPVLVSVDVARRHGRLRLDGIVRTVIALGCYRCAEPAPQCVFSNFSLLLTEEPVQEPEVIDMVMIFEKDAAKEPFASSSGEDDEDIGWDDRLHFPAGEKEIDISKPIRDLLHLEITLDAVCSSSCKGLCLMCGTNLNSSSCNCSKGMAQDNGDIRISGPLKNLRKQMQQK